MSRVDNALLLRDTIQKIVNDKIGKTNPGASYATVTGFNPALGIITVRYPGDDVDIEIPAGSIYPSEVGQVVRIEGPTGSRVVADVKGENLTEVKARTAQETADGKNTVNYGETPPEGTDHKAGDIWFDEGNSNMPHVWKDGDWVSIEDLRVSAIAEAQDELKRDLDYVIENGTGTKSFYKPTEPTAAESKEGDLWFDTSESGNNELHTYVNGQWVSAADARITALKDAQTQMTGDITAAQQKADEAFQNAADADSKAATAQSTANTAKSDAAAAAGIAGGKADVLIQSTTPATDMRKATTLWIDTTGSANTPKRWNGTAWVVVTDKAATDAASAAATAQTKANEAKSAADAAQTTATNAQTAASNAQSTATEALTSANSKNTVTRSTANPTTPYTGRVDDIWWKMSTLSSGGRVIAQYRWSGTAWLTETIDNAVIANLDAAKITTGYLAAARIKANTLNADTVLINGSLGSIILRDGAITTPKIATGAITAQSGIIASLDAGKITVGTLDSARIAANSITADKVFIGSDRNMLPNGDLSLGDATGWPGSPTYRTSNGPPSNVAGSPNVFYTGTSTISMESWGRFPVKDGDVLMFECWVKADKANSKIYMEVRDQDGSHLSSAGSNNWTSVEGGAASSVYPINSWTVPTSWTKVVSRLYVQGVGTREAYLAGFYLNHTAGTERGATYYLAGMKLYKAVGSTLIEPGAITTEKIATGAITAESGVIGSLDASKITVGKLSGARLEADAINGMQIIGATIATSTSFPRVQLDNAGLAVYKSSSVRSFFADASSGDLSIVGDFATATAGNERVFLSNTLWNSIQIVDDTGTVVGTTAGSGIRVGPGDQGTLDLYHGGRLAPSGSYVDVGIMKGPRSAAQPNGASVSVNKTTLPDGSEFNWAALTATNRSGRVVGRVGTSASGPHTFIESDGKIQMSASKGGFSIETDIGSIRTDSKYPRIEFEAPKMMFLAPEPAEPTNPSLPYLEFLFDSHLKHSGTYISSSTQSNGTPRPITIGGWPGTNYVKVDSDIVTLGAQGRVVIDNYFSPVAEFNYGQGNASWNVSFKKAGTDWGYVGSTSGMGVNDFGIQSAAGKRLVLNAGTGSAKITLGTDGSITGLPIATGDGVSFPTVAANGGSRTVTIKFPSGKFNVAPSVSAMTSHGRVTPVVFNITKTGFSFRVWNFTSSSATSVVGTWIAVAAS